MNDAAKLNDRKIVLISGRVLKKVMARKTKANKDHITVTQEGDDTVLAFANEKLVYFIANGVPAAGYAPLRPTAPPA